MSQNYKKFLRKIYAYQFFDDFIFILPLYVVLFQEIGLSPIQIGTLLATWGVTSLLLEVPSGVWADKYSRKAILILGQIAQAIGFGLWIFFQTFWGFFLGFAFWGIATALNSGTSQAFIFDEMKQYNKEKEYGSVLVKLTGASVLGMGLSAAVAMIKQFVTYETLLRMSIGSLLISALIIASIKDVQPKKAIAEKDHIETLKNGFRYAYSHKTVFKILIFSSLFAGFTGVLDEFFGNYLRQVGVAEYFYGLFYALFALLATVIIAYAHKIEHFKKNPLMIATVGLGCGLIVMGWLVSGVGIAIAMCSGILIHTIKIIFATELQHQIPSSYRATIQSLYGFCFQVVTIAGHFLFGIIATGNMYSRGYMFFGCIIAALGLLGIFLFPAKEWKDEIGDINVKA